ncbi:MAG: acetyl-CoA carboxylase biotin carboxylase subunit, partial [Cellulosimicrobium funkei]
MTSRTFLDATAHPSGGTGFRTVLVANRGEIACRVIGTLRRLGVRSVAVFSDADADARHVREADVAVRLGPAPATQSYLDVDAVVAAAVATGAEAVHPGYGFLSENPALARACERAGIAFVGPGVDALEAMADKLAAKSIVGARGVPVVPGAGEPGMSDDDLLAAAGAVGFPLLVKPSAGGGGKGMVVVRAEADLPGALASARRVAASSFGDGTLLLERLVEAPRHIEVQVLADTHGTVVHLGERECSLQRRHQKVVEEAPSPLLTAEQRARMGEAACEVARSVGYVGAGTVEFLVPAASPDEFFFIEMNTRLQVEHPVTEMVTGLDLVALQLRVAAGEPLGLAQSDVVLRGHAVEARLYAESPERGFLPATGSVRVYDDGEAPAGPGAAPLRLDSGICAGSVVGGHYDPMLAKAVAWGETRDEAVGRLDGLLARTVVLGVETNTA